MSGLGGGSDPGGLGGAGGSEPSGAGGGGGSSGGGPAGGAGPLGFLLNRLPNIVGNDWAGSC